MAGRTRSRIPANTLAGILACIAFLALATPADARHPHKHRSGREAGASHFEPGGRKSARGSGQQSLFSQSRAAAPNADAVLQQLQGPDF
jgi:hypothetical protein